LTDRAEHPVEYLPELAMGVLAPAEMAELHSHLRACETCTAEYEELRRVTDLLPLAAEDLAPAEGLRGQVLERIAREPVSFAAAQEQRRQRAWMPAAIAAGLALLALGGLAGFLGGRAAGDDASGGEREQQLVEAAAQGELSQTRMEQNGVTVSFVRAPGAASGFAWVEGLPALPEGKAYQAWFIRAGQDPEPSNVLRELPGGWLDAAAPIEEYAAIALTIEDNDGARTPSGDPVAVVELDRAARAR
jgi:hypothetical protein